jgi:cytochrome c oxidase cbb3-type subunit 1
MWVSGIGQGLLLRAFDDYGNLAYTFVESVTFMHWPLVVRALGGAFFVTGILTMGFNIAMTIIGAKRAQAEAQAGAATASA